MGEDKVAAYPHTPGPAGAYSPRAASRPPNPYNIRRPAFATPSTLSAWPAIRSLHSPSQSLLPVLRDPFNLDGPMA